MRVCSLLPSATEIVFALDRQDLLVGVTHECDYPPEASRIPAVTRTNIASGLSSAEIDSAVSASLANVGSLYELDLPLLERLRPDVILTQRLCDVCAVSSDRVERTAAELPGAPQVVNLEPHSLGEILDTIGVVGGVLGRDEAAGAVVANLRRRIETVAEKGRAVSDRPRVFCMEWVDPPYCGGHWMKELVELAGGRDELARLHRPSQRIEWRSVLEFGPEVIVLTCCGFGLDRCAQEARVLAQFEGARELPAARADRIFAADGSAYFSRPGPRIVDSLEILAHCVHPEIFPAPAVEGAFRRVQLG